MVDLSSFAVRCTPLPEGTFPLSLDLILQDLKYEYRAIKRALLAVARVRSGDPQNASVQWVQISPRTYPRWSMYQIFTYIYHQNDPNVGKYAIHGWSGYGSKQWYGKFPCGFRSHFLSPAQVRYLRSSAMETRWPNWWVICDVAVCCRPRTRTWLVA